MDCGTLMVQQGPFKKNFGVVYLCDNTSCVHYMKNRQGRLIQHVKPVSIAKLLDTIDCSSVSIAYPKLAFAMFLANSQCMTEMKVQVITAENK
jgi:hypothetical protein